MSKLRNPWRYSDVLEYNANGMPDQILLGWKLRLEILERIAKLLTGLHRKKLAYGSLSAHSVYIQSYTEFGIEAKEDYLIEGIDYDAKEVSSSQAKENKQALDCLCLGVLALQMATEKPLNKRLLPQLFKLLKRRGIEADYVTAIEIDDLEAVDDEYGEKELVKEKAFREDGGGGGVAQSVLNAVSKAGELLKKTAKRLSEGLSEEADEYALAPIIKDEVANYLDAQISGGKDIEKPKWMLNLEELIADCLTSVEESRPTASVIRTWLVEALGNFDKIAAKTKDKEEALMDDVDYLYEVMDIHSVLRLCDKVDGNVFVLHSTDTKVYDDDEESLDSFMPPEEMGELLHNERKVEQEEGRAFGTGLEGVYDSSGIPIRLHSVTMLDEKTKRMFDNMTTKNQAHGKVLSPKKVGARFDKQEKLKHEEAVNLLKRARQVLSSEQNILVIDAPATIIGDIHGQYFDLRQIMRIVGKPRREQNKVNFGMTRKRQKQVLEQFGAGAADPSAAFKSEDKANPGNVFLFLGDYVDRGAWSCEVLFYVLSLKVEYPHSVYLLRGNHECDAMGTQYGFRAECEFKYGREIYHRCLEVFKALPIACIVNLPNRERFLACHGGISDNIRTLHDIAQVNRFREPGLEGTLCDIVWSDPVDNDVAQADVEFESIMFIENQERGCGKKFGYLALEQFLKQNKVLGIIRAHQAIEEGFHFHFQNHGTKDHLVATVFSAPNYLNECGNKGAVMVVHTSLEERIRIQTARYNGKFTAEQLLQSEDVDRDDAINFLEPICYTEVPQPEVTQATESEDHNITQQINQACPYMPVSLRDFFESTLDILDRFGDARMQILSHKEQAAGQGSMHLDPARQAVLASAKAKFKRAKLKLKVIYLFKRRARKARMYREYAEKKKKKAVELTSRQESHPQVAKEVALSAARKLDIIESEGTAASTPKLTMSRAKAGSLLRNSVDFRKRSSMQRVLTTHRNTLQRFKSSYSSNLSVETAGGQGSTSDLKSFFESIKSKTTVAREKVNIVHVEQWRKILSAWFTQASRRLVRPKYFCKDLEDGVVLCEVIQTLLSKEDSITFIRPKPTSRLNSVERRQNLFAFFDGCKSIGITSTFFMVDLKTDSIEYVLPCLIELAYIARKRKFLKAKLPQESFLLDNISASTELEIGNVTFSNKEQTMLQLLFLIIDRDDNGIIDFKELQEWADEEGLILEKEDAVLCISAIDYDGDTVIGLADFFQFAAKQKELFETEDVLNFQVEANKSAVVFDDEYQEYNFNSEEFESDSSDGEGED